MTANDLTLFHPTPEVLALGQPERVFAESPTGATFFRWLALLLGAALVVAALGLTGWFWLLSPDELSRASGAQWGVTLAAVVCASLGALFLISGWFFGHASAYALFADALAVSRRGTWTIIPWCEIKAFHPLTLRAFPHLELRDGTTVSVNADGSAFAQVLYREIQRNVDSPFSISRSEQPTAAPTSASPATEAPAGEKDERSPTGMLVAAVLVLVVAGFLFMELEKAETQGGEMRLHWLLVIAYKIGGKWGVAGVMVAAAIGFLFTGLNQLLSKDSRESARRRDVA